MALREAVKVLGLDFSNIPLVNFAIRNHLSLNQFPQPCRRKFVDFVVVDHSRHHQLRLRFRRPPLCQFVIRQIERYRAAAQLDGDLGRGARAAEGV